MKPIWSRWLALALSLAPVSASAQSLFASTWFTNEPAADSGRVGWHVNRPRQLLLPHGFTWDIDGVPVAGLGMDFDGATYQYPDFGFFSHVLKADIFRIRPDTAQINIGRRVGHPVTQSQVNLDAGSAEAPLDGLNIGTFGQRSALYLYNKEFSSEFSSHGRRRTKISFFNLFSLGTDRNYNGGADFYTANSGSGRFPLTIDGTDTVTMAHGASVGGQLSHKGDQAGFFNAAPTTRPVVSGKWSDGTAQRSLLAALVSLGLVTDQTEE